MIWRCVVACVTACLLVGCANLTVKKVEKGNEKGLRYSLPKPFIHVVPKLDGTIDVTVVYLPDGQNTYAINASSWLSAYAYQVSLDQNSLLTAVEFKQNTSVVGQQAAATAGAITGQVISLRAAEAVAAQATVDTAQSAFENARSMRDQAKAALDALPANATPAERNTAQTALARAEAALANAQQVLDRARNTSRALSITASPGTPLSGSAVPSLTSGLVPPAAWSAPTVFNTPGPQGGVLFAIDEGKNDKGEAFVQLRAATFDTLGVKPPPAQGTFRTTSIALGPATLKPQGLTFLPDSDAVFFFSQDVAALTAHSLTKQGPPLASVVPPPQARLDPLKRQLTLPLAGLTPGPYKLTVFFTYPDKRSGLADVTFNVK